MNVELVCAAASQYGLIARGGFAVEADDKVPEVGERGMAKHLLLFGNAGSSFWAAFSGSAEYHDNRPHPLNRWSERIGTELADKFSARALFPFGGPPYRPFLRWGKKAEALRSSQVGILIHPRFGLWHSYRFALAFPQAPRQIEAASAGENICRRCELKPCLDACPVNAFSMNAGETNYDVQACFRYLESNPASRCMTAGCQARHACPQGAAYRYEVPHAAFHMRAFVASLAVKEFPEEAHGRANSGVSS